MHSMAAEREAPDTLSRTLLGLAVGGAKKKAKEPGNKCLGVCVLGVGVLGVGVLPVQYSSFAFSSSSFINLLIHLSFVTYTHTVF